MLSATTAAAATKDTISACALPATIRTSFHYPPVDRIRRKQALGGLLNHYQPAA